MENRYAYAGHFSLNLSGFSSKKKRAFKRHLYKLQEKGILDEQYYRFETSYDNVIMFSVVKVVPENPNDRDHQLSAKKANQKKANDLKRSMQSYINQIKNQQ